jgi:DNA gyrase/topoisomerase IV subunit B
MPTGMHASGIPTVEVIFTVLHAGGKFGQGGYKTNTIIFLDSYVDFIPVAR